MEKLVANNNIKFLKKDYFQSNYFQKVEFQKVWPDIDKIISKYQALYLVWLFYDRTGAVDLDTGVIEHATYFPIKI